MRDLLNHSLLLHIFSFLLLWHTCAVSSLSASHATRHQRLDDQRSALVQLQQELLNHSSAFAFFSTPSSQKIKIVSVKADYCSWKGVRCDTIGHVIGLDLSYYVDEEGYMLTLKRPNLEHFVQNLSHLVELNLDNVDLSAQGTTWCEVISHALPNLRVLSLSNCALSGPICSSLSGLRFLTELHLDGNHLSSLPLNFLANSSHLVTLNLASCRLSGSFPENVFLLPKLEFLDSSKNLLLEGQLPEFPLNSTIKVMSLRGTTFYGKLPNSINNLKHLRYLDVSLCKFNGVIPSSLANLTQLVELYLDRNNFWGPMPPFHREGAPNLVHLSVYSNVLDGKLHSSLFELPSLRTLVLGRNLFRGGLNEFPNM